MNASKTLTAAIAAASIIGTVGYVSAQTTTTEPANTSPSTQMQQPSTMTPPADSSTTPSTSPSTSPSTTTTPSTTDSSTTPAPSAAPSNVPSSSSDMSTPSVTSDVNASPAEPEPKADRN